ncbi:MAG: hypothetical protein LBU81_00845 [Methanosarcinales archaeon]|nr:hypothetical protein [Methanosarcinales archaeon]
MPSAFTALDKREKAFIVASFNVKSEDEEKARKKTEAESKKKAKSRRR